MDKELVHNARNIYRYFTGQTDLQHAKASLMHLFSEDDVPSVEVSIKGTPFDSAFEYFISALKTDSLIEDWHETFANEAEPSHKEASRFLCQLFSNIESDQNYLSYLNVASRTRCTKGTWTDFIMLRPQTKAGWTLQLTLSGSGKYNCVRTSVRTEPGNILLFSPTAYLDARRSKSCDEWLYSWVLFQDEGAIKDMLNWPEIASGIHMINVGSQKKLRQISSAIGYIADEGWDDDPTEVRIRATGVENMLLRCHQIIEAAGYNRTDPRVQAAMRFIEDNLFSDLTIEKIANAACLSASALAMLFKKHCGVSIMQWREEKRMAAACNKLIRTEKRIAQISNELGYVNQMYFSRCFRKYMHISPSDYRSLNQQ